MTGTSSTPRIQALSTACKLPQPPADQITSSPQHRSWKEGHDYAQQRSRVIAAGSKEAERAQSARRGAVYSPQGAAVQGASRVHRRRAFIIASPFLKIGGTQGDRRVTHGAPLPARSVPVSPMPAPASSPHVPLDSPTPILQPPIPHPIALTASHLSAFHATLPDPIPILTALWQFWPSCIHDHVPSQCPPSSEPFNIVPAPITCYAHAHTLTHTHTPTHTHTHTPHTHMHAHTHSPCVSRKMTHPRVSVRPRPSREVPAQVCLGSL